MYKDKLRELVSQPLWYGKLDRFKATQMLGVVALNSASTLSLHKGMKAANRRLVDAIEELLEEDAVVLGQPNTGLYEFDTEREAINSIVIHHSSRADGITLGSLNALELLRLYVPEWQSPAPNDAPRIGGKAIYSGHFDATGKQVFYPYHWIIRQDGSFERLLDDSQIGWHCGDWEFNKRSIAICFDDDLSHKAPNPLMFAAANEILRGYADSLSLTSDSIHGHNEILESTECPGDQFMSGTHWKSLLLHS